MYFILFTQFITQIICLEHESYDYNANGMIVANIKKRDTIPFQPSNRRWLNSNNLSYRKTKDIREEVLDRHFEITQAQLKEAQRDAHLRNSQINEIREDKINSPHLRVGQMRNVMHARGNGIRNGDMRENTLSELPNLNYNQSPNYHDKNHNDPLNEITQEQFMKTKREIIEDKMWYIKQARYNQRRNAEMRGKRLDLEKLSSNYNLRNSKFRD